MQIHNVRLGFANNSSSSHSLIFLPHARAVPPNDGQGSFGWDNFVLVAPEDRKLYAAIQLYQNMAPQLGKDVAQAVVAEWAGIVLAPNAEGDMAYEGRWAYIDHQSVFSLPLDWEGKAVHKGFFQDYLEYLTQPGLAILGGNDNDYDHPLNQEDAAFVIPGDYDTGWRERCSLVARKDPEQGFWTMFNRKNGAKVRFSFTRGGEPVQTVTHASTPELVDVKITDYCPYGCAYCYQGSTEEGRHMELAEFHNLTQALKKLQVFEVALGGGEPTLHPHFLRILEGFRYQGIVPNFTTRNLAWLRRWAQRAPILEHCGSFAYSVDTPQQIQELGQLLARLAPHTGIYRNDWPIPYGGRVSVQYVMGSANRETFQAILAATRETRIPLTLLGYKHTGRGVGFPLFDYTEWFEDVLNLRDAWERYPRISIDTALANHWRRALEDANVPPEMYHLQEGAFSCYYDAVRGVVAPDSYSPNDERECPLNIPWQRGVLYRPFEERFLEAFRSFQEA